MKLSEPEDLSHSSNRETENRRCQALTCQAQSPRQGAPKKGSPKSKLFEICAANNWKPPLFECCKGEGPGHPKMFTFKVIVEIMEAGPGSTVLECFGAPQSRKKTAAQNAAEGAVWYLKHLGFFSKDERKT